MPSRILGLKILWRGGVSAGVSTWRFRQGGFGAQVLALMFGRGRVGTVTGSTIRLGNDAMNRAPRGWQITKTNEKTQIATKQHSKNNLTLLKI